MLTGCVFGEVLGPCSVCGAGNRRLCGGLWDLEIIWLQQPARAKKGLAAALKEKKRRKKKMGYFSTCTTLLGQTLKRLTWR